MRATDDGRRSSIRSPIATPESVLAEAPPFPVKTVAAPIETFFADWRQRLMRNLSRRSTSRWEPLTWVHSADPPQAGRGSVIQSRQFHEHRDTPIWLAIEAAMAELVVTREISMDTAADYVTAYLCNELAAKKLISPAGFEK